MVWQRKELDETVVHRHKQLTDQYEQLIDMHLKQNWNPFNGVTYMPLKERVSPDIQKELILRFKTGGWKLTFEESVQYNEGQYCIKIEAFEY